MESTHPKSRQAGRIRLRLQETKSVDVFFEPNKRYSPTMPSSLQVRHELPSTFADPRELISRWQRTQLGKWTLTYDIREQVTNILNQLDVLSVDVSSMKSELDRCKRSITELQEKLETRPIVKQTNITEIGDGFKVKIPILVTIEEYDDEVTASVSEIELFASGSTEAEAILRLKREIISLYEELSKTPKIKLGNLLIRYLRVLENLVERNG